MKESDIEHELGKVNAELDMLCAARDDLAAKARELTARRAELETMQKLCAIPPSPIRAHVLEAAGIESAEKFGQG